MKIKLDIFDILVIILLICILALRVNHISSYLFLYSDSARDYLVAHHIVKFGETVQLGPWNGIFGNLSTPVYFYFLSLFLTIHDSTFVLQLVNSILQIINVGIIYIFTKKLFSPSTAIIAVLFLVSSYTLSQQAVNFFQPNIMIPFISLICLLLFQSYTNRSFLLLLLTSVVFAFATALHNSAFGFLPLFLISSLCIMSKKLKKPTSIWYYLGFLITFLTSLLVLYLPVILKSIYYHGDMQLISIGKIINPPHQFVANFIDNLSSFLTPFLFTEEMVNPTLRNIGNLLLLVVVFKGISYLSSPHIDLKKKSYIVFLILAIFTPILLLSLVQISVLRIWYFTAAWSLLMVFIAEILNTSSSRDLSSRIFKITFISILTYMFSQNITPLYYRGQSYDLTESQAHIIINELSVIQRIEKRNSPHFFQLKGYYSDYNEIPYQLWNILEREYNERFIIVGSSKADRTRFKSLNSNDYTFLICHYTFRRSDSAEQCLNGFEKLYKEYLFIKKIDDAPDYDIYLFRRVSSKNLFNDV